MNYDESGLNVLFPGYTKAYSYWATPDEYDEPDYLHGTTSGFMGTTVAPASPYAVHFDDGTRF